MGQSGNTASPASPKSAAPWDRQLPKDVHVGGHFCPVPCGAVHPPSRIPHPSPVLGSVSSLAQTILLAPPRQPPQLPPAAPSLSPVPLHSSTLPSMRLWLFPPPSSLHHPSHTIIHQLSKPCPAPRHSCLPVNHLPPPPRPSSLCFPSLSVFPSPECCKTN